MSWLSGIPVIGSFLSGILSRVSPDKEKILGGQNKINEAEVAGAPASLLRLWRSFLGWILALVFAWEVIGRTIISTYWPAIVLPPSMLKEITHLLIGMLGLGI